MAILGFILTICYIPGVTGYALPTGWLLLSATLPFILRRRLLTAINPFLVYAVAGLTWTWVWQQGVYDIWKLAILSGVFALGHTVANAKPLYAGMALGLGVSSVVAMFQLLGYHPFTTIYENPSGLFFNPNVYGEIAVLITVACWASELWVWAALSLPAVFMSQSRTALLALGIVGVIWLWRRYSTLTPIILLVIGLSVPIALVDKPLGHLSYRIDVWHNAWDGMTLFGRGPGSFIITYPAFASRTDTMATREEDAHNDFLQMAYQYGLGCLLLLPLLMVAFIGPLGPERYLWIAFCVIAFFNFPLEIPVEGFLGAFALGRLWRDRAWLRNHWLVRRWIERGWMAVQKFGYGRARSAAIPLEPFYTD